MEEHGRPAEHQTMPHHGPTERRPGSKYCSLSPPRTISSQFLPVAQLREVLEPEEAQWGHPLQCMELLSVLAHKARWRWREDGSWQQMQDNQSRADKAPILCFCNLTVK